MLQGHASHTTHTNGPIHVHSLLAYSLLKNPLWFESTWERSTEENQPGCHGMGARHDLDMPHQTTSGLTEQTLIAMMGVA